MEIELHKQALIKLHGICANSHWPTVSQVCVLVNYYMQPMKQAMKCVITYFTILYGLHMC